MFICQIHKNQLPGSRNDKETGPPNISLKWLVSLEQIVVGMSDFITRNEFLESSRRLDGASGVGG